MTATVTAVGRAVKDCVVRDTAKGRVLNFRMAVDGYNGGKTTDFYNVSVWRSVDFLEKQVVRGAFVVAVGALTVREYEHNGEKRKELEINADRVEIGPRGTAAADDRRPASADPASQKASSQGGSGRPDYDEDVPF